MMKVHSSELRTYNEIKEHYEIEKDLASQLRRANKNDRRYLYTSLYDELFQRVPKHPMLTRKANPKEQERASTNEINILKRFFKPETTFLEIGPGDCSLSFKIANQVKKVYGVDVSHEITASSSQPENFQLIISDGCSIPVEKNSVDLAYSHHLMEHLHPEDAMEQLQNLYNVLTPDGVYICFTPNRLSGPHDVSKYFDSIATGFHLKEYTITELANICKQVGFKKFKMILAPKGFVLPFLLPLFPFKVLESILNFLPSWLGQRVARFLPIRILLCINLIAIK